MAKGLKTGGRQRGTPNKVTTDVREAIARIAQENVESVAEWLKAIDDPSKRLDLFIRLIEYHVPKLARTELTGEDGKELTLKVIDLTGRNAAT